MASFNKVILLGNLTRDPERDQTPRGTSVCSVGLAVNRKWKDEAGQLKEEVTFVEAQAWGKQADTIAQYCRKGAPLLIEGRLSQEAWVDKETGKKRSKTRVVIESFQLLGARRESAPAAPSSAPSGPDSGPPPDDGEAYVPF